MATSQQILIDMGEGLSMMMGLPTIASWKSKSRPKKARAGTFGFNTQTKKLEYWNGSYWLEATMQES